MEVGDLVKHQEGMHIGKPDGIGIIVRVHPINGQVEVQWNSGRVYYESLSFLEVINESR